MFEQMAGSSDDENVVLRSHPRHLCTAHLHFRHQTNYTGQFQQERSGLLMRANFYRI
jgi:hypothetical protein